MTVRSPLLILVFLLGACAPGAPTAAPSAGTSQPSTTTRPLAILVGREPASLSLKPLGQALTTIQTARRLFNATLTLLDAKGTPLPYLASAVPQLNTDSWQVSPDGHMETTYPLAPNLTWHDGAPLTADDFVFAWQVYAEPQLGQASSQPMNSIDEVVAPDPQTVVVRWKRPYPLAGELTDDLPAVPRHILGPAFDQLESGAMTPDAFIHQPYWAAEFVGAGPYKLDGWEAGVSLDGVAFDEHVLGRPKIDRVTVSFSTDQNASLARILGGYVDYASDSAVGTTQAASLRQRWSTDHGGTVLLKLDYYRGAYAQLRPEQASPAAITDVRVRQALAYGVDRQALHDGLDGFEGGDIDAEGPFIPPTTSYYPVVEKSLTKYPYDVRRLAQLMSDAGISKGADGFYQSPSEGHLHWEVKTSASVDNEAETSILSNTWRQAGFDFQQTELPAAQAQDGQARATFPTFYSFGTSVGEKMLSGMHTAGIPGPQNRWTGSNRGGWSNPEFDRLSDTLANTLAPDERAQTVAQMVALLSQDVPTIPLYFYGNPVAATSSVVGPGPVVQETTFEWNIYTWELKG